MKPMKNNANKHGKKKIRNRRGTMQTKEDMKSPRNDANKHGK